MVPIMRMCRSLTDGTLTVTRGGFFDFLLIGGGGAGGGGVVAAGGGAGRCDAIRRTNAYLPAGVT